MQDVKGSQVHSRRSNISHIKVDDAMEGERSFFTSGAIMVRTRKAHCYEMLLSTENVLMSCLVDAACKSQTCIAPACRFVLVLVYRASVMHRELKEATRDLLLPHLLLPVFVRVHHNSEHIFLCPPVSPCDPIGTKHGCTLHKPLLLSWPTTACSRCPALACIHPANVLLLCAVREV